MSDVFEPDLELDQDPVGQDSLDSDGDSIVDSSELAQDDSIEKKQGLVGSFLSMGIFNAMLLLSLIFIFLATLNMLGVLRTYSSNFPFDSSFPWSTQ